MATIDQLIAYIKENQEKYSMEALKAQLLKQGVPPADVENAIKIVMAPPIHLEADSFSPNLEIEEEKRAATTGGMSVIQPLQPGARIPSDRIPDPTESSFDRPLSSAEADFTSPPIEHPPPPDSWELALGRFGFIAAVVVLAPGLLGLAKASDGFKEYLIFGAGFGLAGDLLFAAAEKLMNRKKA